MIIRSTFGNGLEIPKINTCLGDNVSPSLFLTTYPPKQKVLFYYWKM